MGLANEVQVGWPNALLTKLLNMKEAAPAPVLSPELAATLVLEADRPEWEFLRGARLCSTWGVSVATAGELSQLSLENPLGSGVLAVMEEFYLGGNTQAQEIRFQIHDVVTPATGLEITKGTRDSRWPAAAAAIRVRQDTPVSGSIVNTAPVFRARATASVMVRYRVPMVITPGFFLLIETTSGGVAFDCSVLWRERALELSETR